MRRCIAKKQDSTRCTRNAKTRCTKCTQHIKRKRTSKFKAIFGADPKRNVYFDEFVKNIRAKGNDVVQFMQGPVNTKPQVQNLIRQLNLCPQLLDVLLNSLTTEQTQILIDLFNKAYIVYRGPTLEMSESEYNIYMREISDIDKGYVKTVSFMNSEIKNKEQLKEILKKLHLPQVMLNLTDVLTNKQFNQARTYLNNLYRDGKEKKEEKQEDNYAAYVEAFLANNRMIFILVENMRGPFKDIDDMMGFLATIMGSEEMYVLPNKNRLVIMQRLNSEYNAKQQQKEEQQRRRSQQKPETASRKTLSDQEFGNIMNELTDIDVGFKNILSKMKGPINTKEQLKRIMLDLRMNRFVNALTNMTNSQFNLFKQLINPLYQTRRRRF